MSKEIKSNVLFVCASRECKLKADKDFFHRCEYFSATYGNEHCTNKQAQLAAAKAFIKEQEQSE